MDCKRIAIMLSAYIDSELSSEEVGIVNRHLKTCSQCQKKLARMKYINRNLSYEEKFELAPYFETRLFSRIRQRQFSGLIARDFITVERRVIYAGFAFSLILFIFVFAASLTDKIDAYEEVRNYMFQNGSNPLSKQLAVKSEITTDDIMSLVITKKK